MPAVSEPTVLIVPGLRDAIAQHWQTLLEVRLRTAGRPVVSVPTMGKDNLWNQSRTEKMSTVKQIEQLVRISREFGREVASGKEAREICKIGVFYDTVEETLAANGFAPNAKGRQQGFLRKAA